MGDAGQELKSVEVVLALPDTQVLVDLTVGNNATVEDAIRQSRLYERFPQQLLKEATVGIWGRPVARDTRLANGDRIEFYRPLTVDPREARRARAG